MQRTILFALPLAAAAIGFWLLAIAPKRDEASKLETEAIALESQVEEQRLVAETAEQAREDFPRAYRRVVVLGKAAPSDDDTSSLLVQLSRLSKGAGVEFGAPPPSRCQFLTLKEGQEQKLDYAPNGEPDTYILDVKDIRLEEVEDPRDKRGEGMTEGARDGLSAFAD